MRRGMLAGFTAALLATVGAFGSADAAVAAPDDSPRVPVAALAEAQRIATTGPISVAAAVDRLVGRTGKSASRAVAPTATTPVDDVAAAALICVGQVIIRSAANGLLISAELGYSGGDHGMLRARAAAVGPWELFTLCQDEASGLVLFVSEANGLAVSAELGYSGGDHGMLRARASAFGPWEWYALHALGDGTLAIQSAANGLLVSAELGYSGGDHGMLRARASAFGPWERFA